MITTRHQVYLWNGQYISAVGFAENVTALISQGWRLIPPCPTCSWPRRETVGLVCQTCGTDYGVPTATERN